MGQPGQLLGVESCRGLNSGKGFPPQRAATEQPALQQQHLRFHQLLSRAVTLANPQGLVKARQAQGAAGLPDVETIQRQGHVMTARRHPGYAKRVAFKRSLPLLPGQVKVVD